MKITKEVVVPNYGIEGTQGPDGKPAIYTTVTNQNIVLNAPYQGLPSDYSKANGSIQVFEGDKEVTQQATYTLKQTLNVAAELDFNKFKVTHVSTDNDMFIVTVSYKEFVSDIMITTNVVRNGQSGQSSYIHRAWSWSADGTDRFTTKYPNENLIVQKTITKGFYLNSDGTTSVSSNWSITDFIEVRGGDKLVLSGFTLLGSAPSTCFYNSNKEFISGVANGGTDATKLLTVPSNAKYVRYTVFVSDIRTIKLEYGIESTIYTPSPKDDYDNAYPKYEGYYSSHNPEQSTNPVDYEWTFIPQGQRGPKGDTGDNGQDGPPTGIIESPTIPTEVYQGMLWKNTGNLSGFITDTTYIYRGSKWEKYIFTADNIYADNLSAITANLGDVTGGSFTGSKFINTYDSRFIGDSWQRGSLRIEDGVLKDESEYYNKITGEVTNTNNFYTLHNSLEQSSIDIKTGHHQVGRFSSSGILLTDSDFSGYGSVNLTYQDLMTIQTTRLDPVDGISRYADSGSNMPSARRNGRIVTLAGGFKNNKALAAAVPNPGVLCILPVWARPSQDVNFIVTGTGKETFLLWIRTDGRVQGERYGVTGYAAIPIGRYFSISCVYSAKDL